MSLALLPILLISILISSSTSTETLDFELKPAGKEQSVEQNAYGVTCKFIYYAEGGTKEHWTLTLKRSKDHKDVLCVAERPEVQSYLMFEAFTIELSNAHIKSVKMFKDHEEKLPEDSFVINEAGNSAYFGHIKFERLKHTSYVLDRRNALWLYAMIAVIIILENMNKDSML